MQREIREMKGPVLPFQTILLSPPGSPSLTALKRGSPG
jgi:hypothetical protein